MNRSYFAYGFRINSAITLPELVTDRHTADVEIRVGKLQRSKAVPSDRPVCVASDEDVTVFQPGVGSFLVRAGREIVVDPIDGVADRLLRLYLLGPALGVLLHQRGFLVLHASAVTLGQGAVVFLGASGWGKSTMAAALHSRGYSVLADDMTAVRIERDRAAIVPGFPRLKLWPSAIMALPGTSRSLPRIHPEFDKRSRAVPRGFSVEPVGLRSLYVLSEGAEPRCEMLESQEGLVEIIRHSYCAKLLRTTGASSHFRQCAAVAAATRVKRLMRPRDLSLLPTLARLVEDDR